MEFLDTKVNHFLSVFYKVLNQGLLTNKIFVKKSDKKIEDQGDIN